MADIALLLVEEVERTAKKMKLQQQQAVVVRRSLELPAGADDGAASQSGSEWSYWGAPAVRMRVAAAAEPAAALGLAAVDGFFSA